MNEWIAIMVGIMVTLLSGAISYGISNGVTKARINGMRDRLDRMEKENYVTRYEYEYRQREMMEALKIIINLQENKKVD